jgi:hypothetical protein
LGKRSAGFIKFLLVRGCSMSVKTLNLQEFLVVFVDNEPFTGFA